MLDGRLASRKDLQLIDPQIPGLDRTVSGYFGHL